MQLSQKNVYVGQTESHYSSLTFKLKMQNEGKFILKTKSNENKTEFIRVQKFRQEFLF